MGRSLKRKFRNDRVDFRKDLYEMMKDDLAMAMLVQQIHINERHSSIILKTWEILGLNYPEVYKEGFCGKNSMHGRMFSGKSHDLFHNLYFLNQDIYKKYSRKIPPTYALGDALSVAHVVINDYNKKRRQGTLWAKNALIKI